MVIFSVENTIWHDLKKKNATRRLLGEKFWSVIGQYFVRVYIICKPFRYYTGVVSVIAIFSVRLKNFSEKTRVGRGKTRYILKNQTICFDFQFYYELQSQLWYLYIKKISSKCPGIFCNTDVHPFVIIFSSILP